MKNRHVHFLWQCDTYQTLAERRLVFLNEGQRKDEVEEAERRAGKPPEKDADPLELFRARTGEIVKEMEGVRGWFFKGMRQRMHLDQAATEEAHRRVEEALRAADGRIKTKLRGAERRLLHQEIKKQILEDVRRYLETERAEIQKEHDEYLELARYLGGGSGPVKKGELERRDVLLSNVGRVQQKVERKIGGRELPEQYGSLREAELLLRQQIVDLDIADAEEIEGLLEQNMQGSNALIDRIAYAPAFADRKNKDRQAIKSTLIRAAKTMRRKKNRGYRLLRSVQQDLDVGTTEERLKLFRHVAYPGYPVKLHLDQGPCTAVVIRMQGEAVIMRDKNHPDRYIVLDTGEGVVAARNKHGDIQDFPIDQRTIALNPPSHHA